MSTDWELLDAWRAGDKRAADELIRRNFDSLCRFFRSKVHQGVEDLIQKTLLTLLERRDRFPEVWSFQTCMFTVARDHLYKHYRKRGREARAIEPGVTSIHDLAPSPSQVIAGQQQERVLLEALRRIPVDLQIALELHYWEGMRGPQLAAVLDIPEGTVRSRLRRGKQLLGEKMVEIGASEEQLETTMTNLDGWARALRDWLAGPNTD